MFIKLECLIAIPATTLTSRSLKSRVLLFWKSSRLDMNYLKWITKIQYIRYYVKYGCTLNACFSLIPTCFLDGSKLTSLNNYSSYSSLSLSTRLMAGCPLRLWWTIKCFRAGLGSLTVTNATYVAALSPWKSHEDHFQDTIQSSQSCFLSAFSFYLF
jgi:hypothetical protein